MTNSFFHLLAALLLLALPVRAENGSRLWLRAAQADRASVTLADKHPSETMRIAADELRSGWRGEPVILQKTKEKGVSPEAFRIRRREGALLLTAAGDAGLLYGAYHLLRLQECGRSVEGEIAETPAFGLRILNHWDNLDGTIERGYAGRSLWNWSELPERFDPRYREYARANASIGINATVLNNVNASPQILSSESLQKVKALADGFRPYGIRVCLSINFASPMVLGGLPTADPLDPAVIRWWREKTAEIYRLIPDFGGFLVKANSEGQPGPCDFGRTHAEGANLLADALKPYKGVVMWRAFVYSPNDADRAKQAVMEFEPLDGCFRDNVIVQIKNGPVDFQPREPYSPLFTRLRKTSTMVEFQVTQEYLGHANHLVYLAPMWKEFFGFVAPGLMKAVSGVANIGTDTNWCGHDFAQANWYAFGRLAWNPGLTSEEIAEEWLDQTFTTDPNFVEPVRDLMCASREACVNYMMPLGLHHIFANGHHYGPGPWETLPGGRADWQPWYYHNADAQGVGFDRTPTGSNAVAQYPEALAAQYGNLQTCPPEYLLWFHHVGWSQRLPTGETLWEALCSHYDRGVQQVRDFQRTWDRMEPYVDADRFRAVQAKLKIQARDAQWWKDGCLLYFQRFSGLPIPWNIERPVHELEPLQKVQLPIDNYTCPSAELLNQNR